MEADGHDKRRLHTPLQAAIGMLYSLIVQFPDLDPMLRPVILELEKIESPRGINPPSPIDGEATKILQA
jgi:hypothetical protein